MDTTGGQGPGAAQAGGTPRAAASLRDGAVLPESALTWRFSRSGGPGGQSVNTTDSRVELVVDLDSVVWGHEDQRTRVLAALAGRLRGGVLTVVASEYRSQLRNRAAALERVVGLLDSALAPPPPGRRATRPSRASRLRRTQSEQRRRSIKDLRRRPPTQ